MLLGVLSGSSRCYLEAVGLLSGGFTFTYKASLSRNDKDASLVLAYGWGVLCEFSGEGTGFCGTPLSLHVEI